MAGCTWCQVGDGGIWASESQWADTCGQDKWVKDGLGFYETVEPVPAYAWKPWDGTLWSPFLQKWMARNDD